MSVSARLPLYLTHLLTYLYKQASSVSSIRVSVRGQGARYTKQTKTHNNALAPTLTVLLPGIACPNLV